MRLGTFPVSSTSSVNYVRGTYVRAPAKDLWTQYVIHT